MAKKLLIYIATALVFPLGASATEYRTMERPRQECWNEQVPVQAAGHDLGGAILGGIAGGLIGNQVGGGNGRAVATAVGAATGAMMGDRINNSTPGYQTVRRCRTAIDQVQVAVPDPQPVYVAPKSVYVEPEPIYMPSTPVIAEQGYYIVPDGPVYYRERRHGRWHEDHHRHHDDDD